MGEKAYTAGLYLRLSKDDERTGESLSIENQRILLTKHAEAQGWAVGDAYADDGYSGTNFDRPAFRRLLQDAAAKRINLILVKDMSRLGRNHIEVGHLTEDVFPALGIRFVAVNDNVDSLRGEDDMTACRNLFNEFQSKDTSRKIRAVRRACMERGLFMGMRAPFGYKKDAADRHRLVVDVDAAETVRRIFRLRGEGHSARAIVRALEASGIPSPGGKQDWCESTIRGILRNEVYIGHAVQGKASTVSYKNRKVKRKPPSEWVRVENTHEPLVSSEEWAAVSVLKSNRRQTRRVSMDGLFAGMLFCADCGAAMRVSVDAGARKDGTAYRRVGYLCATYSRHGKASCTAHIISEPALSALVLQDIRAKGSLAAQNSEAAIQAASLARNAHADARHAAEATLAQAENDLQTLYADRLNGVLGETSFSALMPKYEQRREDAAAAVLRWEVALVEDENHTHDVALWAEKLCRYAVSDAPTREMLHGLIRRVDVLEAMRVNGRRTPCIRIFYRLVGTNGL